MPTPLQLLIVEDNRDDAELVVLALHRAGYSVTWRLAQSESEYLTELHEPLDVILCDYSLPEFGAHQALRLLNERSMDVPLIVVTGTVDDHAAAESMRHGAVDYILKDRPGRLGQAVTHAIEQKRLRIERQQAEAAMMELNTTLNAVIQASPIAVVPLDLEGKPIIWYAAAETIFGWTREEALGRGMRMGTRGAQSRYAELCDRVKAGETVSNINITARNKEGSDIDLSFSAAPLHNVSGQITGLVVIFADITENRKLQAELLEAQKLDSVGRLAGGIAHDFNNMLTAIMGFSELMTLRCSLDENTRGYVDHIRSAAQKAHDLSQQLLAFARRQQIEPRSVDLNELILGIEMILRRLIGENIELKITQQAELYTVLVDPGQFEQILVNLVINSRDAIQGESESSGVITIETQNALLDSVYDFRHADAASGEYVLLSVADSGKGMDEVTRARVFEPFFTTKEDGMGTGLGLATAYGIVKQAVGHITIRSAPGKGTTVQIYLPRTTRLVDAPAKQHTATFAGGVETILVAEDEPAVRDLAVETLTTLGYRVLSASNGKVALSISKGIETQIALLVTDLVMPKLDGIELADRIRRLNPSMKVLFATGYPTPASLSNRTSYGIHFMAKPYFPTVLAQKVREILDLQMDSEVTGETAD